MIVNSLIDGNVAVGTFAIDKRLHPDISEKLSCPIVPSEIQKVVFNSNPLKAPRPDGFNLLFFQ